MKIGVLKSGHLPEQIEKDHGGLDDMFSVLLADNGFTFANYSVVDNHFPASVEECDGWLVTGSAHGAYDDLPWIGRLEDFIRQSYDRNIPIAGICFGHQVLAQALGGRVEKFAGGWGIGRTSYSLTEDNTSAELLALHQDQVVEIPPQAKVIASTEFCAIAGLAYKGSALSFQPHPEFTPEYMRDIVEHKVKQGNLSQETADTVLKHMGTQFDSARITMQLVNFFKQARGAIAGKQAAE